MATVSGMRVPRGWGKMRWGDGERRLAEGGASRVWPCTGAAGAWPEGERLGSQGCPPPAR